MSYAVSRETVKSRKGPGINFGYLRGNFQKDGAKRRLDIVQRYLIQKAIELDLPILNSSLTKRPTHTLQFNGGPAARVHLDKAATIEAKF
jgi:hypothetical protein